MRTGVIWIGVVFLLLLAYLAIPWGGADLDNGDYWMSVGSYTSRGGKGIYLSHFHSATGKLEPAVLAAGSIWQSNRSALAGSLPREFAQIQDGWPNLRAIAKGVQNPVYLALHPNGRYLYAAEDNGKGAISGFRTDATSNRLTALNSKSSSGGHACFASVDRSGRYLLVANYGGSVAVFPIAPDGRLRDATAVIWHKGWESGQAHAHSIDLSPDNRFAIVSDLGRDEIFVYRFDSERGLLTPNDPPSVRLPAGSLPRHFSFHPNGIFAYVIGESSRIFVLRWDSPRGVLTELATVSTLPGDFHGVSAAAELQIHPNGKFLYASNREHNSIAVFAIDQSTGDLTAIEFDPVQGNRPANLRIDPTGGYLFAANMFSNNVVEFRIDSQTGHLTPTGVALPVAAPAGIQFMPAAMTR